MTRLQAGHPRNHDVGYLSGVQTSKGTHPVSYSGCTEGSFPEKVKTDWA